MTDAMAGNLKDQKNNEKTAYPSKEMRRSVPGGKNTASGATSINRNDREARGERLDTLG